MLSPPGTRVVIATAPVDFRRGHDGLAAVMQEELGLDPYSGVACVFRSRSGDRVKILWYDGTGLVLGYKRLEQGRFSWPGVHDGVIRESLRAQVEQLGDSNRRLGDANRRLEGLISELRRLMYRRKSEKLPVDDRQMSLAFEDLKGAIGAVRAETLPGAPASPSPRKRRAPRRNLGRLGEQGLVPSGSGGGPAGVAPEAVRASVHGRDPCAGAGPGPGQDEDGLSVGTGPGPGSLGRSGTARGGVLLCARPYFRTMRSIPSRLNPPPCRLLANSGSSGAPAMDMRL